MTLRFNATNEQMMQLAANAYNASIPMGMGFLQYTPDKVKPLEFRDMVEKFKRINIDYYGGRMVKLRVDHITEQTWEIVHDKPHPEYQSWCNTYPTYKELLHSAGIEEIIGVE